MAGVVGAGRDVTGGEVITGTAGGAIVGCGAVVAGGAMTWAAVGGGAVAGAAVAGVVVAGAAVAGVVGAVVDEDGGTADVGAAAGCAGIVPGFC